MKEIQNTINRIKRNDTSKYPEDGEKFDNIWQKGPEQKRLNTTETYKEWTVKTPYVGGRAERRIVVSNQTGKAYYTHDHYTDYIEIILSGWN